MQNQLSDPKASALPPDIVKTLNAKNKAQLTEILEQVCALQKAYGKTPSELETLVEGFAWALADFPMPKIVKAMRHYVLNHSDIPAPADIRAIITRQEPGAPPSVEKLREYRAKGIRLTPNQEAMLGRCA